MRFSRNARAALVGVVAAAATAAPIAATPAQAYAYCNLYVPSRVAVWQQYQEIAVTYGEGCVQSEVRGAQWEGTSEPQGLEARYDGDGDLDDRISLRDRLAPTVVRWRAVGGSTRVTGNITMNEPTTTIKFGAVSYVSVKRTGSYHEVTARAYHYSRAAARIVPSGGRPGQVQFREPESSTWRPVAGVTVDADGRAIIRTWSPGARAYRVSFGEQPSLWGTTSSEARAS